MGGGKKRRVHEKARLNINEEKTWEGMYEEKGGGTGKKRSAEQDEERVETEVWNGKGGRTDERI